MSTELDAAEIVYAAADQRFRLAPGTMRAAVERGLAEQEAARRAGLYAEGVIRAAERDEEPNPLQQFLIAVCRAVQADHALAVRVGLSITAPAVLNRVGGGGESGGEDA